MNVSVCFVCLFVCPLAYIKKSQNCTIFCTCYCGSGSFRWWQLMRYVIPVLWMTFLYNAETRLESISMHMFYPVCQVAAPGAKSAADCNLFCQHFAADIDFIILCFCIIDICNNTSISLAFIRYKAVQFIVPQIVIGSKWTEAFYCRPFISNLTQHA